MGVGGMGGLVRATRQACKCIRALIAGEQTACRFAVAYALRLWLGGFFLACWFLRLNNFHAIGLAPSGGHILSSPAKKEYGKKDAAQGGVFPALRTHPLGWVSVVRVAWYGLPGKFASASVPCKRVSRPLAASLLLTHCGGDLKAFFRVALSSV